MNISLDFNTVKGFMKLFDGNTDFFGKSKLLEKSKESNKQPAEHYVVKNKDYQLELVEHLKGNEGLGISPVKKDNTCSFAVIDLDDYVGSYRYIPYVVHRDNYPLCVFKSKSGGYHIYAFFSRPIPAGKAQDIMSFYKIALGLPAGVEVFPKRRDGEGTPAWVNLPYFGDTRRLVVGDEEATLVEALPYCENRRLSAADHLKFAQEVEYVDAPPCIQAWALRARFISSDDGNFVNNFIFSAGTYLKKKYKDTWETKVHELNKTFGRPLPDKEIDTTILSSLRKKDYNYRCKDEPLVNLCNRELCADKDYGVKKPKATDGFEYGDLHQYLTDDPYYVWYINGVPLTFKNETEFMSQTKFRELAVRQLHKYPVKMKVAEWDLIVAAAVENITSHEFGTGAGTGLRSSIQFYLKDYVSNRILGKEPAELTIGRVIKDEKAKVYYFAVMPFVMYVENIRNKKSLIQADSSLTRLFGELGIEFTSYGGIACWAMPYSVVSNLAKEPDLVEVVKNKELFEDMLSPKSSVMHRQVREIRNREVIEKFADNEDLGF